ncbi:MAG: universal stress protein [Thermodesulfobacteriota bacterium]
MTGYHDILYCTDFSEDAEIAFIHAVDLAERYRAKLHILHVLHSTLRYTPTETDEHAPPGDVTYASDEVVAKALADLKQRYAGRLGGVKETAWAVKAGTAFVEILRYSRDHPIDLIVMGSVGASQREQTHYGSTVDQVARRAHCHVMAIKNPERTYTL